MELSPVFPSQLLWTSRQQDDMTAFDWMCGEQGLQGGGIGHGMFIDFFLRRDISIDMVSYKYIVYKWCVCVFLSEGSQAIYERDADAGDRLLKKKYIDRHLHMLICILKIPADIKHVLPCDISEAWFIYVGIMYLLP